MKELKVQEYKRFEDIKHIREDGSEYWSARELALTLDYTEWRNFSNVIGRAMIACENSGHSILNDFVEVNKIVEAGATSKSIKDYELTRYACYLIVQNAGYMGLYGGMDVDDIHAKKNLEVGQKILEEPCRKIFQLLIRVFNR